MKVPRKIAWSLLAIALTACTKETPPPRRPGDSCANREILVPTPPPNGPIRTLHGCPEGMRCKFQRTALPNAAEPECELVSGRCWSASDCEETGMDCKRSSSEEARAGFCVPAPL